MKKGESLKLVKTTGREPGNFDLYNLVGLSLGKVHLIYNLLKDSNHPLADEILATIGNIDGCQTINGK